MFLGYPFLSPESVINRKVAVTTTKKENVFKERKKGTKKYESISFSVKTKGN